MLVILSKSFSPCNFVQVMWAWWTKAILDVVMHVLCYVLYNLVSLINRLNCIAQTKMKCMLAIVKKIICSSFLPVCRSMQTKKVRWTFTFFQLWVSELCLASVGKGISRAMIKLRIISSLKFIFNYAIFVNQHL